MYKIQVFVPLSLPFSPIFTCNQIFIEILFTFITIQNNEKKNQIDGELGETVEIYI